MAISGTTYLKPRELFNLLDRYHERQRVLLSGLEAIVYGHPYKKFYFSMDTSDYRAMQSKTGYPLSIDVHDYGMTVGNVGTFKPDGQERTKMQVQFRYDYDVHQKEPRHVKRSSDHKKISDFAKLFRPVDLSAPNFPNYMFDGTVDAIRRVTKLRGRMKNVNNLLENFYFGDKLKNAELMYNLVHGTPSPNAIEFKEKFEAAYAESRVASEEFMGLTNKIAVITSTPHGEYLLCRYQHKNKASMDREEFVNFDRSVRVYDSRDALPDDVIGKMSVLEIANTSDDDVEVEGVGVYWKNSNRMVIIGEDLNGIDTGTEGQNPSSEGS